MSSKTRSAIETINAAPISFGSTWQHYKGGVYAVDFVGIDTRDGSAIVIYHRIDGPDYNATLERDIVFARPASEWLDIVDGDQGIQRFTKVTRAEVWQTVK